MHRGQAPPRSPTRAQPLGSLGGLWDGVLCAYASAVAACSARLRLSFNRISGPTFGSVLSSSDCLRIWRWPPKGAGAIAFVDSAVFDFLASYRKSVLRSGFRSPPDGLEQVSRNDFG